MSKHFLFVIDTNQYAGNFERELVAYITGQVGECGVGIEYREMFEEEVDQDVQEAMEAIVAQVDFDGDGCERPAMIWPTPNRLNNGVGLHYDDTPENRAEHKGHWPAYESVAAAFDERPSAELISLMKQRAQRFTELFTENRLGHETDVLVISGFRLVVREVVVTTKESMNEEAV